MMSPDREQLLQPTLGTRETPFSTRATFFVAFLGGPLAFLIFSGINARRLHRLRDDLWMYIVAAIATVVFIGIAVHFFAPQEIGVMRAGGARHLRLAVRGFALLLWAIFYFTYKRFYRAAEMVGDEPPSPWKPGIVAVLIGATVQLGVSLAFLALRSG